MGGNRKFVPAEPSIDDTSERRRRGVVVHDDRGNGRLEWVQETPSSERTLLSIADSNPGAQPERGYDPYASTARAPHAPDARKRSNRRDLRKLSEWIEQVRRAEALKQAERDEEDPQA